MDGSDLNPERGEKALDAPALQRQLGFISEMLKLTAAAGAEMEATAFSPFAAARLRS